MSANDEMARQTNLQRAEAVDAYVDELRAEVARLREERDRLQKSLEYEHECWHVAKAEFAEAESQRDALRAVVRDLEWSGLAYVASKIQFGGSEQVDCCPICGACKEGSEAGDGVHVEGCTLRAALGEE